MDDAHLLAALIFSETKNLEDAKGVANVVMNRLKKPQRFGATLPDVIYAPSQFSGVNTEEYKKAINLQFKDKNEEKIFKSILPIANQAIKGTLEDNTGGSNHYVNLRLSKPSWIKKMEKKVKISEHTYYKE